MALPIALNRNEWKRVGDGVAYLKTGVALPIALNRNEWKLFESAETAGITLYRLL